MSTLFTIGNLLNMETETIKRCLWTELRPVLCFISDLTFYKQVTVTIRSLIIKFTPFLRRFSKPIDSINLEALHFCISAVDELTLICFMSLSVEKCKFFKTASNIRSFLKLGSLMSGFWLLFLLSTDVFSSESAVYFTHLESPFDSWGENTSVSA